MKFEVVAAQTFPQIVRVLLCWTEFLFPCDFVVAGVWGVFLVGWFVRVFFFSFFFGGEEGEGGRRRGALQKQLTVFK